MAIRVEDERGMMNQSEEQEDVSSAVVNSKFPKHTECTPERSIESYGLLDLYSYNAFHTVLHTPRLYDAFAAFLRSEHSFEKPLVLDAVSTIATRKGSHLSTTHPVRSHAFPRRRKRGNQNISSEQGPRPKEDRGFKGYFG